MDGMEGILLQFREDPLRSTANMLSFVNEQYMTYKMAEQRVRELEGAVRIAAEDVTDAKVVRALILAAAKQTQEAIEEEITKLVSEALSAVFPDPYSFRIEFVERRGQMEADLILEKDGRKYDALNDCGGGVVDVISIMLRLCAVLLSGKRKLLIADEPGRMISAEYQPKVSELLQKMSNHLGIQIIYVTHSEAFAQCADKTYRVTNGTVEQE